MSLWNSLHGMMVVEFTGADPEKTMDAITQEKIPISHVIIEEMLTCQFIIRRRDYGHLATLLHRRGEHVKIVRKLGIFWELHGLLYRPVLLLLFLILAFCTIYLPSRIFFVTVDGNEGISERHILSAAEECGIRFGASRKLVRSEKMKNELLSAVPQLQWAGVNTSGCTARISVRERKEADQGSQTNGLYNLIADRDGFVLSTTVTDGTAHVVPGDVVTKGQLLISGYTDCGICLRTSRADGEILALTNRQLTAVIPKNYYRTEEIPDLKYQVSLLIGKKRINLWKDSRISNITCGRMYEEYYFSLPGDFRLPLALCLDRYISYELQEYEVPEENAQTQLQLFSENYLIRQMIAGQIDSAQHRLISADGRYRMESKFICKEMIAIAQREQIGVINGKRN